MLKLLYDLKVGFDGCYLTIENQEFDLGYVVEKHKDANRESGVDTTKPHFSFPDTEEDLFRSLQEDGDCWDLELPHRWWYDDMRQKSREYFAYTYLRPFCCGKDIMAFPTIWEPYNFQLEYDPTKTSKTVYDAAFSSSDACKLLGVSRQQLHYYVKTGKIKREFCEGVKSCRYNKDDVYKLLDEQNKKG